MKMNVPAWSPIEFHYEVYLLGAGCQALGQVLLGSLRAPAPANLAEQHCPDRVIVKKIETKLLLSVTFFLFCFCLFLLLCSLPYQIEKSLAIAVSLFSVFYYSVLKFPYLSASVLLFFQPNTKSGGKEE